MDRKTEYMHANPNANAFHANQPEAAAYNKGS